MKNLKSINLRNVSGVLADEEMKRITGGSVVPDYGGGGGCGTRCAASKQVFGALICVCSREAAQAIAGDDGFWACETAEVKEACKNSCSC